MTSECGSPGAIPEFVDVSAGVVVPAEDSLAIANAIKRFYTDKDLFQTMSRRAAVSIQESRSSAKLTELELSFFLN